MSLLVFIIVVLVVTVLGLYLVTLLPEPVDPRAWPLKNLIRCLIIIVAIIVILNRSGLLSLR